MVNSPALDCAWFFMVDNSLCKKLLFINIKNHIDDSTKSTCFIFSAPLTKMSSSAVFDILELFFGTPAPKMEQAHEQTKINTSDISNAPYTNYKESSFQTCKLQAVFITLLHWLATPTGRK